MAQLVECRAGDRRVAGLSLTAGGVNVLCLLDQNTLKFIRCLVLVQLRNIHRNMTEKLVIGA